MGANAAGAAGIQPGPGLVVEGELDRADVDVAVEGAPPPGRDFRTRTRTRSRRTKKFVYVHVYGKAVEAVRPPDHGLSTLR